MPRIVCFVLILAVLGAACGTASVTPLSDEERCARFSGTWNRHSGQCGGSGP